MQATLYGLPILLLVILTVGYRPILRGALRLWPLYLPLGAILIVGIREIYHKAAQIVSRTYLRLGNRMMTQVYDVRETGRRNLDRLLTGEKGRVQVLAEEVGADSNCPICRNPTTPTDLSCDICRVKHHKDCFEYNEGCGIYGCGGAHGA